MWILWAMLALVLLALGIYVAMVAWDAKVSVDAMPRKEAFVCQIHGPMPVESTIILFGSDLEYGTSEDKRTQRGPIRKCSICFEESFKTARRQKT